MSNMYNHKCRQTYDVLFAVAAQRTVTTCSGAAVLLHCNHCDIAPTASTYTTLFLHESHKLFLETDISET